MSELDKMIDAAVRRGEDSLSNEPRALRVQYDTATGRVDVELTNGCCFAFQARRAEGLSLATDAELAQVEVLGAGYGLHWDCLDVDLSVPGLLLGMFGTKSYMDRMRAAQAGKSASAAKSAAARINGLKGGRPRKSARN